MNACESWTDPYWALGFLQQVASDPWPENKIDLAIIGAGLTGLITGLTAARQGMQVAIFEAHFPGAGASCRNAGYITAGTTRSYERCASMLGTEKANQIWQFSIDAATEAAGFIQTEGIDCNLRKTGRISLAVSKKHADSQLRRAEQEHTRFGWKLQTVGAANLGEYTSLRGYHGGLYDPLTWGLDPSRLVMGLVQAFRAAGGKIIYPARIDSIDGTAQPSQQVRVHMGNRSAMARMGMIGLDGFSDQFNSPWARQVFSVGSALLVTEPLSTEQIARFSPRGMAVETSESFKRYFRVLSDGRLLIGGRNSLLAPERQANARGQLQQRSKEWITPDSAPLKISHAWPCRLGFTMSMLPILARQGQWYFSGGYCGHGIPTSIALGQMAGKWLAGTQEPGALLREIPHGMSPPRVLHQPFLGAATMAFRLRDWIALRGKQQ